MCNKAIASYLYDSASFVYSWAYHLFLNSIISNFPITFSSPSQRSIRTSCKSTLTIHHQCIAKDLKALVASSGYDEPSGANHGQSAGQRGTMTPSKTEGSKQKRRLTLFNWRNGLMKIYLINSHQRRQMSWDSQFSELVNLEIFSKSFVELHVSFHVFQVPLEKLVSISQEPQAWKGHGRRVVQHW